MKYAYCIYHKRFFTKKNIKKKCFEKQQNGKCKYLIILEAKNEERTRRIN